MKLNVDFSSLHQCIENMGASIADFDLDVEFDPIDIELDSGIDIDLKDIETTEGILSYRGRQVLLYIPDQARKIATVLEHPEEGKKFHISDCTALKNMRNINRFDRYVVTNDLSGNFKVNGVNNVTNLPMEGTAELKVCKFCLSTLNYDGYAINKSERHSVFGSFKIDTFFETYSTVFKYLPKRIQGIYESGYAEDWKNISSRYREKMDYTCEECKTDFIHNKNLLHTHHISGVKSDNSNSNLKAVCVDCHKKEPMHEHIFIHHDDMLKIYEIRRSQGKMNISSWKDVYRLADTSLHGYLKHAQESRSSIPEIGYMIEHSGQRKIIDIAWPNKKIGVVISKERIHESLSGWKILSLGEEMKRINQ